jgi:hypothetical protein
MTNLYIFVQVCKLLLESGADPRVTTKSDNTVLHYLAKVVIPKDLKTAKECKKSLVAVLQLLVERGADVNCKNNTGVTPLHEAAFRGAIDVVNFLVKMREIDINSRTLGNVPSSRYLFSSLSLSLIAFPQTARLLCTTRCEAAISRWFSCFFRTTRTRRSRAPAATPPPSRTTPRSSAC